MSDWRQRAAERAKRGADAKEHALAVVSKVEQFLGTTSNQKEATRRLGEIAKECHLISPARVCPRLPEGTAVAFSMVLIDTVARPDGTYAEIYPQQGKFALLKPALIRIQQGAGVRPDPELCRRTDDGSDARYYSFQAVGYLTQLDGTVIPLSAHKEYDLRPDSPMVQALETECIEKAKRQWKEWKTKQKEPDDKELKECKDERAAAERGLDHAEARVRSMQEHAMAHCDTKAFLRMVRNLGIRQAYTLEELAIPFVTARLQWTGETDDPELRKLAFTHTMNSFGGGRQALYGTPPASPSVIDVPRSSVRVSTSPERDEDEPPPEPTRPPQGPQDEAPPEDAAPTQPAQPAAPGEAGGPLAKDDDNPFAGTPGYTAPEGGPKGIKPLGGDAPPMSWKGKPFKISASKGGGQVPIEDVTDPEQLRYWIERITKELDAGVDPKFEKYTIAKLDALEYQASRIPPF